MENSMNLKKTNFKEAFKKTLIPILVLSISAGIWAIAPHLKKKDNSDDYVDMQPKTSIINNQKVNSISSTTPDYTNYVAENYEEDKTFSPYFIVLTEDSTEKLPLRSTSANVNISGTIADVTVTQVYRNDGKKPLEAIYTFPASSKAAVYSLEMFVGNRKITAVIKEKVQARLDYEQAKENGQSASLLEQVRPNIFQMNVANIQPNEEIKVSLKYTELIVPESGTYQFVYPTVVGPRYTKKIDGAMKEVPYSKAGVEPTYNFNLTGKLIAGMKIQDVSSQTHKVNIMYQDASTALIQLDKSEVKSSNKDFILEYKLAGNAIETGLLLYNHGDENFFLLMTQPPNKVKKREIPPREYIFIMDESGSMAGVPIDISKKILRNLISNLLPTDKFNVLVFSNDHTLLSPTSLDANEENINKACSFIDQQQGASGTEILPALDKALNLPRDFTNLSRSFVVLTDGYIDVEKESFSLIRNNLNKANLFVIGIGSSVNRYYLEGMAHAGMGELMVCNDPNTVDQQAEKFRKYVSYPVLTQVEKDFGKFNVYDVEPLTCPDLMAERPLIIFGKYKGEPKGKIKISGFNGNEKFSNTINVENYQPNKSNVALRYLWARERIKYLDDYSGYETDSNVIKEVTNLGLKYNLLTAYTSFIAIDSIRKIDPNGKLVTVHQENPLPENVDNYAVGADEGLGEESESYIAKNYFVFQFVKINHVPLDNMYQSSFESLINSKLESIISSIDENAVIESISINVSTDGKITSVNIIGNSMNKDDKDLITKRVLLWDFSSFNINTNWEFTVKF